MFTGAKYISDKGKCLKEFNNAEKDLDNLFKGAKKLKKDNYEHASQRGFIYKHIVYLLDGGNISVKCDKWDKDTGIKDSLVFDIFSKNSQTGWIQKLTNNLRHHIDTTNFIFYNNLDEKDFNYFHSKLMLCDSIPVQKILKTLKLME